MEAGKLQQEAAELQERVESLKALLGSPTAIRETVGREAGEIVTSLGDARRTKVNPRRHLPNSCLIPSHPALPPLKVPHAYCYPTHC
jgi:DNA gyrase/topoisomerase IV subunit A